MYPDRSLGVTLGGFWALPFLSLSLLPYQKVTDYSLTLLLVPLFELFSAATVPANRVGGHPFTSVLFFPEIVSDRDGEKKLYI